MTKTASETLAANLLRLKAATPALGSQAAIAEKASINQRTVGRILNKEHAPTVDQVTKLAKVFNVEAWQLLAPGLGAGLYAPDAAGRLAPVLPASMATALQEAEEIAREEESMAKRRRTPPATKVVGNSGQGVGRGRKSAGK